MSFAALPNAVFFAVAGVLIFAVAIVALVRVLPDRLWARASEEQDLPAALLVAAFILAIGWIIAAAVH